MVIQFYGFEKYYDEIINRIAEFVNTWKVN